MPTRDSDLMQLADGELDPATAADLEAGLAPDGRAKLAALRDLREAVRGHLELRADEAEPRLVGMWAEIDKRLSLDAPPVRQPAGRTREAKPQGLWARFARWVDDHRSHVLTGVLSAGAVAALALVLRPQDRLVEKVVQVPVAVAPTQAPGKPQVQVVSTPPAVESLDVAGGTGTVWTIEDDDGKTAVIWVTPDDTVEGL